MTRQTFVYRDDSYTQSAGERVRDAATALRITQQTDEAIAYVHAKDGCPFEDGPEVCPVCDSPNAIANVTAAFFPEV